MLFRRRPQRHDRLRAAGNLHLVRHGEVTNPDHVVYASLDGFHLSELGRRQAAETADHLGARDVAVILSSPLDRAVETAAAIAAPHGLDVVTDERLTEWRLADRWAGVVWEDLPERFPGELEAYLEHPDDLAFAPESLAELGDRMASVVEEWSTEVRGGDIVVVSHQDPIQAARFTLTGRSFNHFNEGKPTHGAVITLVSSIASDTSADADWIEAMYWEPAQGASFPPGTT